MKDWPYTETGAGSCAKEPFRDVCRSLRPGMAGRQVFSSLCPAGMNPQEESPRPPSETYAAMERFRRRQAIESLICGTGRTLSRAPQGVPRPSRKGNPPVGHRSVQQPMTLWIPAGGMYGGVPVLAEAFRAGTLPQCGIPNVPQARQSLLWDRMLRKIYTKVPQARQPLRNRASTWKRSIKTVCPVRTGSGPFALPEQPAPFTTRAESAACRGFPPSSSAPPGGHRACAHVQVPAPP